MYKIIQKTKKRTNVTISIDILLEKLQKWQLNCEKLREETEVEQQTVKHTILIFRIFMSDFFLNRGLKVELDFSQTHL